AAPGGDHKPRPLPQGGQRLGFLVPESALTMILEDARHRRARPGFHELVRVHELPSKPRGENPSHGRLARAHEADENDAVRIHDPCTGRSRSSTAFSSGTVRAYRMIASR